MSDNASVREGPPLLLLDQVSKVFKVGGGPSSFGRGVRHVHAVNNVSLKVDQGQTYGLVGESGSGKTTVGRMVVRLIEPTGGNIAFKGRTSASFRGAERRQRMRSVQMVFQDPYSSLNPRQRVGSILRESLLMGGVKSPRARSEQASELLAQVGLSPRDSFKYPHEFSGGQRQRIGLARALALRPELIVCDEPVSALDVSIQAQILNLMREVQERTGVGYLFISHDMGVVRHVSDTIGVMYFGRLVEEGPAAQVFSRPRHPYTRALLSAVPRMDRGRPERRERIVLHGEVPSHTSAPPGCVFASRCPSAMPICHSVAPAVVSTGSGSWAACHLIDEENDD